MTKQIVMKNNRTFQVEATLIDYWNYKVSVFEIFEDESFKFIGKAISNDIDKAIEKIIK